MKRRPRARSQEKKRAKPKRIPLEFAGYKFTSGPEGTVIPRGRVDTHATGDYGADPMGDGTFRMVPSGDIVSFEERNRRLKKYAPSRDFNKADLWRSITADQKKAERAKLAALSGQVKKTRRAWPKARAKVQGVCLSDRLKARAKAKAVRLKAREESKRRADKIRQAARASCALRKRALPAKVQTARAAYLAERKHQAEMRRIARMNAARRPRSASSHKTRQGESDDEVRHNLPPDLRPLFERVKRSVKATPRKSRTEAFLEYVEAHPREQYAGLDDKTDALVRELEARQRSGRSYERRRPAGRRSRR